MRNGSETVLSRKQINLTQQNRITKQKCRKLGFKGGVLDKYKTFVAVNVQPLKRGHHPASYDFCSFYFWNEK